MIHYSCDRCKRSINTEDELRYVVRLEVHAAMEPLDVEEIDDDRDHLLEIDEILERMDDADSDLIGDDVYQRRRYDLCAECYRQYIRNPIAKDTPAHIGFSSN